MARRQGEEEVITKYLHTIWRRQDVEALSANTTDPKHQAAWEAYVLLCAVCTWCKELGSGKRLLLRGDAQGVLQGVIKGSAKSAAINLILAELQLVFAPLGHDVTAMHILE